MEKRIIPCLALFLILMTGILGTADAIDGSSRGENRILNSSFETDSVGEQPVHWALEKGG